MLLSSFPDTEYVETEYFSAPRKVPKMQNMDLKAKYSTYDYWVNMLMKLTGEPKRNLCAVCMGQPGLPDVL